MLYRNLIKKICMEENIEFKLLSGNYIISLTKNNVTKYIWGHKFPLNDHAIGNIIDDKYALYTVCKDKNIPIIEHRILWTPTNKLGKDSYKLLKEYYLEFNKNVVIKPNNGSKGIGVSHITNFATLKESCQKLLQNNFSISICPFYNIEHEYRVIILDNEVKFIYEKSKPIVIGDGIHTIKELLNKLNHKYFSKHDIEDKYNIILDEGQVFEYDWHFNLSKGATANYITDENLKKQVEDLALNVTKTLKARFVSVDIIKVNNNLLIMEINSGVCINKACSFLDPDYKITKEIYREAIKKMFD